MQFKFNTQIKNYLCAFILIALACSIQLQYKNIFQSALFIILYPTTFVIVYFIGLGPGLFSIFLSCLASLTLFTENYHHKNAVIRTMTFSICATIVSLIMNRTIEKEKKENNNVKKTLKDNQDLFNFAPCGYHSLDIEGRIIKINQTELNWLGFTEEEVLMRSINDFLTLESQKTFKLSFTKFIQDGYVNNVLLEFIKKDQSTIYTLLSATAIYDSAGRFLMSRSTLIDYSSELAAQSKIAEQQKKLLINSKFAAIGEMSSGMAHEINNPLSIIKSSTQKLLKASDYSANGTENLHKILNSIDRIAAIIEALKLVSLESNPEKFSWIKLSKIIANTIHLCGERIKIKSINLTIDPIPDEIEIFCHENQIMQAILNLLLNAYQAVESNQLSWIQVKFEIKESILYLKIIDSGLGISEKIKSCLMQPFITTKQEYKNIGLGLSITLSIAKMHQGNLSFLENEKHTTFLLELPHIRLN